MVFILNTAEYMSKVIKQSMGYSARKLLEEFPDKDWTDFCGNTHVNN